MRRDEDRAAASKLAAAIGAVVPDVQLVQRGRPTPCIECFNPEVGDGVCLRLDLSGEASVLNIVLGDDVTPIYTTGKPTEAVTSFIWADSMLRTRFAELQDLLSTRVIPRCVNNCDDLHNFVD